MSAKSAPFWHPDAYAARRPGLLLRAQMKAALRDWFAARDFLEVETGILQVSPGNETHLHAMRAAWLAFGDRPQSGYLHTSPEFAMKKLLAAGEQRIYQFANVFRARESSPLHAPEFAMLEWYRAGESYEVLMRDCAEVLQLASKIGGRSLVTYRGRECDITAEPERLSVTDAFERYAGIDLAAILPPILPALPHSEHADAEPAFPPPACGGVGQGGGKIGEYQRSFRDSAHRIGIRVADDDTWSDIFSRVVSEKIEPHLGIGRPVVLDRYPISEAALARPCSDNPDHAERFELYVSGVELANAFGELTDAGEQRKRFEADMAEKQRLYSERYPLDEDFLAALTHMPPASGIALGFDRLVMLAAGAENVRDVIFTPWPFGEA